MAVIRCIQALWGYIEETISWRSRGHGRQNSFIYRKKLFCLLKRVLEGEELGEDERDAGGNYEEDQISSHLYESFTVYGASSLVVCAWLLLLFGGQFV